MINKLKKMKINIENEDSSYEYNGTIVPRVTHILQTFNEDDRLMYWANSLGFRRIKYKDALNRAATIGTHIHNGIEKYIETNSYLVIDDIHSNARHENFSEIDNGIRSFIEWYDDISKSNNIEIIDMEQKLVCCWFGGTYDCLIKINGKIYLMDFKSSNHVSYKYFLQLSAYIYMLKLIKNIDVEGCIVLQVDKNEIAYEEYVLDFAVAEHKYFINQCTRAPIFYYAAR